jgi:hypothetical protein
MLNCTCFKIIRLITYYFRENILNYLTNNSKFAVLPTDELDRLLEGSGTVSAGGPSCPGARRERMYYGAAGSSVGHGGRGLWRHQILP